MNYLPHTEHLPLPADLPTEAEFEQAKRREGRELDLILRGVACRLFTNPFEPEYDPAEAEQIRYERMMQIARGER